MIKHTFAIGLTVFVCGCSVTNSLRVAGLASAALMAKMIESGSDTIDEAPPKLVTVRSTD